MKEGKITGEMSVEEATQERILALAMIAQDVEKVSSNSEKVKEVL